MALDFPNTPSEGDIFTASNGVSWMYSDGLWLIAPGAVAVPNLPSMTISAPTHDMNSNSGVTTTVQTTLTSDDSGGVFAYDPAISETNTQALGGIVIPPGIYAVTLEFYVNSKTGVIPVAADSINTRIAHRTYPSGGTKLTETSYFPRGVITTVEAALTWTVRTTVSKSKMWVEIFQTMTLPAPTSASGVGALSTGKFTFSVTQLKAI